MSIPATTQKESSFSSSSSEETSPLLTQEQKDRMEQNRKRALDIRKEKEDNSSKMYSIS